MEKRLGVVGIVVENREIAPQVNSILSEYADIIIGRIGLPHQMEDISVISLITSGASDEVRELTGKLGKLKAVQVTCAEAESM
ncbi:MAG TPA: CopG family transcriptional regulator [Clostridiaceae bacterium]|nr:CopG family transcriptional regulator [Clostridiaceae bacterium]